MPAGEPLYVVDGFIYFKDASTSGTGLGAIECCLNPLATITPGDIASIEVLKDVSATAITAAISPKSHMATASDWPA